MQQIFPFNILRLFHLYGSLITVLSEHFEDPFDIYRKACFWFIIQRRNIQFLFSEALFLWLQRAGVISFNYCRCKTFIIYDERIRSLHCYFFYNLPFQMFDLLSWFIKSMRNGYCLGLKSTISQCSNGIFQWQKIYIN